MLLLGTTRHLEDLDCQYSLAEDVVVTAIAAGAPAAPAAPAAYVLLDGERIAGIDEFELVPIAELPKPGPPAQSLAVSDGSLLVGFAGAHLAVVDPRGGTVSAVDAFEHVAGREEWENPAGVTPDLRSIAVTDAGTWLVNVHVGGVWRSTDRGAQWENVVAPPADVHEVVAAPNGRVVAAAAGGFGWSTDDGRSWDWTAQGLHASYCRAVALDGDTAYVAASTGPSTSDARLYRCRLGGVPEPCGGGLPASFPFNLDTGSLAARDGHVALGTRDGQVWRSSDGAATFEAITERVGHVLVLRFA